ncbi:MULTISPECIES: hypothetical protein [Pseudomonas]|uniref:Uncharacterized protein n=1 Tax=Pseudomonas fluorescens TaxID=294 RepID=A0A109LCL4_PSEFL|nr:MULTISPECIES: hypothetical protein [Pseudomonas]KWV85297.1 hypothetical protein PFLmoz3_05006 [Pseudomonas fluorescens]
MGIDNLMVTLNRVPELHAIVETGTDWVALLGSLTAVVAVVAGSAYNAYSFKKTIISQEKMAEDNAKFLREQSKSEFLAKSRLDWIAIFREHVSNFLSLGNSVYAVSQYIVDVSWVKGDAREEFKASTALYDIRYAEFTDKLSKARLHFSQIELLISPNGEESEKLIRAMNEYIQAACSYTKIVDRGQAVVDITQRILRDEWVKVKEMKAL